MLAIASFIIHYHWLLLNTINSAIGDNYPILPWGVLPPDARFQHRRNLETRFGDLLSIENCSLSRRGIHITNPITGVHPACEEKRVRSCDL